MMNTSPVASDMAQALRVCPEGLRLLQDVVAKRKALDAILAVTQPLPDGIRSHSNAWRLREGIVATVESRAKTIRLQQLSQLQEQAVQALSEAEQRYDAYSFRKGQEIVQAELALVGSSGSITETLR